MILFKDENYKLDLGVIDRRGDFKSGLTVTYELRKSSDNSLVTLGTMTEVGSSGVYQTSSLSINSLGKYRIEYVTPNKYENIIIDILVINPIESKEDIADQVWNEPIADHLGGDKAGQHLEDANATADPSAVADAVWDELISEHSNVGSFAELIKRIAGLCQENYRIFNPTYNNRGELTAGTIKIYPSASDVDADTNAIAQYSISATYNSQNKMTSYKVKKL